MTTRYDALVGRKYTRDGVEKTAWSKIGVAWPSKSGEGFNVQLDAMPAPQDGAFRFVLFPPREDKPQQSRGGGGETARDMDDSIPFITPWGMK